MKEQLMKIALEVLEELREDMPEMDQTPFDERSRLFGAEGRLDSLGLVSFISEFEQRIAEAFECDLVLANEKAMSSKVSPFRSVSSVVSYAEKLLAEETA